MQFTSTSKPRKPIDIAEMIEKVTPDTLPDFLQFDDVPEGSERFWEGDGFALADPKNISPDEVQRNFIRAAEESLAHYEATGLHITHEEYKAWRASNGQAMPECHT
jgi:hypothetical protein